MRHDARRHTDHPLREVGEDTGSGSVGQSNEDTAMEDRAFITESCPERAEEWVHHHQTSFNDRESEDVLHTVNPNEVFNESNSAASDSPDSAHCLALATPTLYRVVYDTSGVGGDQQKDLISIELGGWSSPVLLSDACVVNELPLVSAIKVEHAHPDPSHAHSDNDHALFDLSHAPQCLADGLLYPELNLTEEEQKLLNQEGVALPNNMPLTKAEERVLKKVRRKIRNKQSAQDSRRRRKEYVDCLESRVATCSAQNNELQRTVEQLEKHNLSLADQLRRLQSLVKQTASKAAQTGTCIMILFFSLTLIIFPNVRPFSLHPKASDDTYTPTGVISRNILNEEASPLVPPEAPPLVPPEAPPLVPPEASPLVPPEASPLVQSESTVDDQALLAEFHPAAVILQQTKRSDRKQEVLLQEQAPKGKSYVMEGNEAESVGVGEPSPPAGDTVVDSDASKPAHADEM